MQCRTHPDINGVNTCNQCGDWLCEDCTVEINGRIFCRRCLAEMAKAPGAAGTTSPDRSARGASAPPPRTVGSRHISWGLLFVFSCFMPPGVNYLYEGLIKRGLAALSGFFLLVYLTAQFHMWPLSLIFGLTFPVYILTCVFDGFSIRRRMNAGEVVSDDIDDILGFLKRNKHLIVAFGALLLVLSLVNTMFSSFAGPVRQWLPILVIGFGLYALFKRPRHKGGRRDDRRDDVHHNGE